MRIYKDLTLMVAFFSLGGWSALLYLNKEDFMYFQIVWAVSYTLFLFRPTEK